MNKLDLFIILCAIYLSIRLYLSLDRQHFIFKFIADHHYDTGWLGTTCGIFGIVFGSGLLYILGVVLFTIGTFVWTDDIIGHWNKRKRMPEEWLVEPWLRNRGISWKSQKIIVAVWFCVCIAEFILVVI